MTALINRIIKRTLEPDVISFRYPEDRSSSQFSHIKKRLITLVGTDVIRLNDKQYIDTLIASLTKEYNVHEDKREQELAEAEIERLRTLKLRGVIPEDVLVKQKHTSKKKRKKKKRQRPRTADVCKTDTEGRFQLESYMSMKRGMSQHPDRRWSAGNKRLDVLDTLSEADSQTIVSSDEEEETRCQSPAPERARRPTNRKEPAFLKQLRDEETVAGLYKISDHLVVTKPTPKVVVFKESENDNS